MGAKYLKIMLDELGTSGSWKALEPGQQAAALRDLVIQAQGGVLPGRWKRMAQLREVGVKSKATLAEEKMPSKYSAFYAIWEKAWEKDRGEPYVWDPPQRGAIRAAFAKCGGSEGLFDARILAMLRHQNDWYRERASPKLLASHFNELGGGKKTARNQPPPPPEKCSSCEAKDVSYLRQDGRLLCIPCYDAT
jgi:hypothetical protein